MTCSIQLKRAYEPVKSTDGIRILVERLWPRGISKEKAHIAEWLKEIAPSAELRQWYQHDVDKWPEFKKKYLEELKDNDEAVKELKELCKEHSKVTFVYAAKDEEHNSALVLKHFLDHKKR
jgi:uncharacterized protein YeaO (DUF488 family)